MPPKKKEAAKAKDSGGDDSPEEQLKLMNLRNTTLQLQLSKSSAKQHFD
jgi:hypothetical protein